MNSTRRFLITLHCGLVCSCAGDPSKRGDQGEESAQGDLSPNPRSALPKVRQLRVDLAGTDAAMRIVNARLVDVPESGPMTPSLGGAAILVGYSSAGTPLTAMPFSLPKTVRFESSKDGVEPGGELPLDEGSLTLYLDARADMARIEVLGEAGAVLATLADTEFDASGLTLDKAYEPGSSLEEIVKDYPHIEFLRPGEGLGINPPKGFMEATLIGDKEARDIRRALNAMTDATFSAIRTIAVAQFAEHTGQQAVTFGSTVVLNRTSANLGLETSKVVAHEATHAYEYLVNGGLGVALFNRIDWPDDVKGAARETIQDFNLQAGLTSVWNDLHEAGVEQKLGRPYMGDKWKSLGTDEDGDAAAAPGGFVSMYGAKDASEDLCEYVGRLVISNYGGSRPACDLVKAAGNPFPVERALPYMKVKFLEGLGLVSSEQARSCIGEPSIEGPPGVHVGNLSLTDSIQGGFIDLDGGHFLGVLASTAPWQMLIRVLAPETQPRGIYRLDNVDYLGINGPTNAVLLGHDTDPLLARTSAGGLVLVSEYSPQRIAGALFFLRLRNGDGKITGDVPLSTFRVDRP
jgi:hypothetical protein